MSLSSAMLVYLRRQYLTASPPYFFVHSLGRITLPTDLLIFCPLMFKNPLTRIVFGNSIPADLSIAGHKRACHLKLSFPKICTSAGQNLLNNSLFFKNPTPVK